MADNTEGWKLDRTINLIGLIAIIAQTGAIFWFQSELNSRVTNLESNNIRTEKIIADSQDKDNATFERVIRTEEKVNTLKEMLQQIDDKLDQKRRMP